MSEYKVMLDISILETAYVEADTEDEAVKKAVNESNLLREGGDYEVFEVSEVRQAQS